MNAQTLAVVQIALARLTQEGVLRVAGADARAFLHAQLTNDIEHLAADRLCRAGWCTAQGRLLATPLVVPIEGDAYLLLLPSEIIATVMKRLKMFVLRSKVTIDDASAHWQQFGASGAETLAALAQRGLTIPQTLYGLARVQGGGLVLRVEGPRVRILVPSVDAAALLERLAMPLGDSARWMLEEIRHGLPQVVAATQDLFVPQMMNFDAVAGLDFKKGCYPGQEVVARAHYRGQVKRRMVRARAPQGATLGPGQDLYCDDPPDQACGTVVAVASAEGGAELLAVVPLSVADQGRPIRVAPRGAALELLPLPYAV